MPTKRPSSSHSQNVAKLPKKISIAKNQFTCINPLCNRKFETKKQYSLHFFKSACSQVFKSTNKPAAQCKHDVKLPPAINQTLSSESEQEDHGINLDYMNASSDESKSQQYYPESSSDDDSTTSEEDVLDNHCSTTIKLQDNANWTGYCTPFTIDMLAETTLLKILDDANAPHYLFEAIMHWACEFHNKKYNFKPSNYNRKNLIAKMKKWQGLDKCLPKQIPIQFEEDGLRIELTAFDFQSQLMSLLKDPTLVKNIDMLDVNKDDPFSKYQSPSGRLTCFNSGSWYHNAWTHGIDYENDWLCPIIF